MDSQQLEAWVQARAQAASLGASAGACAGASSMRVNLQSVRGFVRSVCLPGWCALAVKRVGVVLLEGTRSKERRREDMEKKNALREKKLQSCYKRRDKKRGYSYQRMKRY